MATVVIGSLMLIFIVGAAFLSQTLPHAVTRWWLRTQKHNHVCCRNFGELCCMKLILSELQRDLRHRLAVYAKTEGTNVRVADKRNALLENSQLWRLLQVSFSHRQAFHAQRHACDVTAHDTHIDGQHHCYPARHNTTASCLLG